jgi:hypothetical protein
MQYLDGETLAERLTKGALPLDQALRIAIDVADALDKAHRAGIVPGMTWFPRINRALRAAGCRCGYVIQPGAPAPARSMQPSGQAATWPPWQ